jgi:hypothetical protein
MTDDEALGRVLDVVDLLADSRDLEQEELLLAAVSEIRKRDAEVSADD